jgi:hypothetical protein
MCLNLFGFRVFIENHRLSARCSPFDQRSELAIVVHLLFVLIFVSTVKNLLWLRESVACKSFCNLVRQFSSGLVCI